MHRPMADLLKLIWSAIIVLFRSRASLEAEILTLRHQLNVLRRKSPKRLTFSNFDRLVFATLYRFAPGIVSALAIVEPETVRWHRAGFRLVWRWKSRCRVGRPKAPLEIRQLIRDMSRANPLWGAPRIHGESEAWHRRRPDLHRQIHGKAQKAAVRALPLGRLSFCRDGYGPSSIGRPGPGRGLPRAPSRTFALLSNLDLLGAQT
jgi:hypothetical protein